MGVHKEFKAGVGVYVDDTTHMTVPGVTSIIGNLPKPFLTDWAAKMTAQLAVDSVDFLTRMAATDPEGAVVYLKGAARRYTKERGRIGSAAHDVFERMARSEEVGLLPPDIEPYRRQFDDFLAVVNPELVGAEDVAWSDTHGYAGSFDALWRVWLREDRTPDPERGPGSKPMLIMGDYKTGKSTYPDVALQLSAYAHADRIIAADGSSTPMPDFDGGLVLHITPDGWSLPPIDIGDAVFRVFLALMEIHEWNRGLSRKVIGRPIAKSAKLVTGTERRAR